MIITRQDAIQEIINIEYMMSTFDPPASKRMEMKQAILNLAALYRIKKSDVNEARQKGMSPTVVVGSKNPLRKIDRWNERWSAIQALGHRP